MSVLGLLELEACGGKASDRNAIEPKVLTYGSATEAEVDELTEEAELPPDMLIEGEHPTEGMLGDEGDEIGRVALAYNQMLDSMERQIGKRPASQGLDDGDGPQPR